MVSICIPYYKNLEGLERLLDSIKIQTYKDFEVIISDDSGELKNHQILENYDFNILYYKNIKNLGATKNTNIAINYANGELIKIMHDDDYFLNNESLQKFVELIGSGLFAYSGSIVVDKNGKHLFTVNTPKRDKLRLQFSKYYLFCKNYIGGPSSVIFRKGFLLDEELTWLIDIDLYIRLLEKKKKYSYTNESLIYATRDSSQVTFLCLSNKDLILKENIYVFLKYNLVKSIRCCNYLWNICNNYDAINLFNENVKSSFNKSFVVFYHKVKKILNKGKKYD